MFMDDGVSFHRVTSIDGGERFIDRLIHETIGVLVAFSTHE